MREIKFRGKATQDYETSSETIQKGDWVYGHYAYFNEMYCIHTRVTAECGGVGNGLIDLIVVVDPETVGQFTSLKDKNSKHIFHGDFLEDNNSVIYEVCHNEHSGGWILKYHNGGVVDLCAHNKYCKIVGNRYNNPELLEKTK